MGTQNKTALEALDLGKKREEQPAITKEILTVEVQLQQGLKDTTLQDVTKEM